MDTNPSKSWRESIRVYQDKRSVILLLLGFSAGLPLLLIFSSLSLWLREAGVERGTVTLFSWAALFYSFKFIWAPLIDLLPLPVLTRYLGRRRSWLILTQLIIITALIGLANINPAQEGQLIYMAIFAALLGLGAASQDIVIDAYRIESAPVELQSALAACYTAGYRLGMLMSGAGALYLATFLGASETDYNYTAWQQTYLCMAALFLVGIITSLLMPEPKFAVQDAKPTAWHSQDYLHLVALFFVLLAIFIASYSLSSKLIPATASLFIAFLFEAGRFLGSLIIVISAAQFILKSNRVNSALVIQTWVTPLEDFFKRYGKQAIILLLIIGFYRISDVIAGVISNVFYQDLGFSKNEIATAVKTVGVLVTLLGGFIGGVLAQRYAILKMLLVGGFFACITNLLFVLLSYKGQQVVYLYVAVIADNLTAGLASAVFIAFLSSLTNIRFTAVQYALFSSLMTLFPKLLGGYSGALVNKLGYGNFFIIATVLGLPVLGLIMYLIWQDKEKAS